LQKHVVEPENITIRRWQDGSPIGFTRLKPDFRIKFHAPYYLVHRAHFHDAMHQLAVKSGADVKVAHKVVDYDENVPSVRIENGQIFTADLIVAADGLRSIARSKILGGPDVPPGASGFAAFRATVDASKLRGDPELAQLIETAGQNPWIGYQRHIMAYTIAGGSSFNMVLNSIDHSDPSTWNPEDAVREMREWFKGWDPRVTRLVKMIDRTLKWPLMTGTPLDRWVSKSGKLLMLGDASHAMVPYMSQGAAMAVEDGGALAKALRYVADKSEI
jgi:salicylate hydroxylase